MRNGRYFNRPHQVDCWSCSGPGAPALQSILGTYKDGLCLECYGTGLDPIPWEELFGGGRGIWQKNRFS